MPRKRLLAFSPLSRGRGFQRHSEHRPAAAQWLVLLPLIPLLVQVVMLLEQGCGLTPAQYNYWHEAVYETAVLRDILLNSKATIFNLTLGSPSATKGKAVKLNPLRLAMKNGWYQEARLGPQRWGKVPSAPLTDCYRRHCTCCRWPLKSRCPPESTCRWRSRKTVGVLSRRASAGSHPALQPSREPPVPHR